MIIIYGVIILMVLMVFRVFSCCLYGSYAEMPILGGGGQIVVALPPKEIKYIKKKLRKTIKKYFILFGFLLSSKPF